MMPPLRSFDDVDGRERGQKKTDDLRAMTTLGPRTLYIYIQLSSRTRRVYTMFSMSRPLNPAWVYANSGGSGENVQHHTG